VTVRGTVAGGSSGSWTPPLAPGIEALHLQVDGVRLRVLAAGDKNAPPLVLLHGIAGSADEWQTVMPGLAAQYRVLAPDAPGHGFSEKPSDRPYDVPAYINATLGTLDALGVHCGLLVALSGAGPIGATIALDHPDRVEKLILVDAAGLGREVSWKYRLTALPLARRFFPAGTNARAIETFGRALLYRPDLLPDGWVERRMHIWASEGAVDAFFATARDGLSLRGQRLDLTLRLSEISQPTLILWGRQDPIIPVAHAVRAAQQIPGAELHIFEQCGHMPLWEYPNEFVKRVLGFLGHPAEEPQ
jgi:pimeloyl-ACP methyl ester carboxylesterase